MVKFQNINDKPCKLSERITFKESGLGMALNFAAATLKDREKWSNVLKILKEYEFRLRIPYIAN